MKTEVLSKEIWSNSWQGVPDLILIDLTVQKLDVLQKAVVHQLHAGWFINRTSGEFINWGLLIKFKGLLCGNPTERGESLILNFWPYKSNPGTVIVCRTETKYNTPNISGKKRHININFFVRLVLGQPRVCPGVFTGFVPGRNPMKTWDKPGFSPYFTQWKPDFTGFVPGTNPVCPWDNPGDEGRHRKFM